MALQLKASRSKVILRSYCQVFVYSRICDGITSDPNQYSEDEQYIVKLVGQVTRVSLETVAILRALPELHFGG